MKKSITLFFIIIIIMSSLFPIANNFSKGISLTKLSDGSEFKEILLPSLGGTNNAAKIELPKTAIVTKADFNVTGLPDASGKWPRDVSIDVGNDGDYDWNFSGNGYGRLGHQNVFSDNSNEQFLEYPKPGYIDTKSIYLPKNATVTKATAEVIGGCGQPLTVIWEDDFSTNKAWTGYGSAAQWQRGPAKKSTYDPGIDHSISVDNYILGNNIGGNYANDISSTCWITSPIIDLRGITNVYISFYRMLSVEHDDDDHAYFQVTNGAIWSTLYDNGGRLIDKGWYLYEYEINYWADNEETFRFRFGLGKTDYGITYGGWNIDDVRLTVGSHTKQKAIPIWREDFYKDKNWTGYGGDAEWERGPADPGWKGKIDPKYDHTPSSDNYLIGTDIGGYYNMDISKTGWLTSPIINCSIYKEIQFEFYHTLRIESFSSDKSFVSAYYNGGNWYNLWHHNKGISTIYWTLLHLYAGIAGDYNPDFRIRFGLGPTDDTFTVEGGWSIDDVLIKGIPPGPVNAVIDFCNDQNDEWNKSGLFEGTETISDFSDSLNSYISTAPIAFNDRWGNGMVEIPINVTSNSTSVIRLNNLNIEYNYTAKVDINPHIGNLTNELNQLLPHAGEGNITIPITISCASGGKLNISNISINYYIPPVTNDAVYLLNGNGQNGKTCFTGYQPYTFLVNVSSRFGYTDISNVTLSLSPDICDIILKWNRSSNTFMEIFDPNDYVNLKVGSCKSLTDYYTKWSLNFVVDINWTYPDELPNICNLNTTSIKYSSIESTFLEVYQVENDLNFIGNLEVTSAYQGMLTSGDWVKGNETINWTGLKVVYEGTTDIFPSISNFNITITNDKGHFWKNTSCSGSTFNLETYADTITDYSDIHHINITEIPGTGQDISNIIFEIKVDATPPSPPKDIICYSDGPSIGSTEFDNDGIVYINWTGGPWQDSESGKYNDSMTFNDPFPTKNSSSGDSIVGNEGLAIFYVRTRDNVGNWAQADTASIIIDLTSLIFSEPFPKQNIWQTSPNLKFGVTISDTGGTGVSGNNIQYRYSGDGQLDDEPWVDYQNITSKEQVNTSISIDFETDGVKLVQWRAKDVANAISTKITPYITSPQYSLKIDATTPTIEIGSPQIWCNSSEVELKFYINDTGGSGIEISTVEYAVSFDNGSSYSEWNSTNVQIQNEDLNKTILNIIEYFPEGFQNTIRLRATDIAGNIKIINKSLNILIDLTPPSYYDMIPNPGDWQISKELTVGITFSDNLSALNLSSIKYRITINGSFDFGPWLNVGVSSKRSFKEIIVTLNLTFDEGVDNAIQWQIFDIAENILVTTHFQIKIDLTQVTFKSPYPIQDKWQNSNNVKCGITVEDIGGSKVNCSTVQYRISKSDKTSIGNWLNLEPKYNEESVTFKINVSFFEGHYNYIQWRATDVAGNDYKVSPIYQIKVDITPVKFYNPTPEPNKVLTWQNVTVGITISDALSGVEALSILYSLSFGNNANWSEWFTVNQTNVQDLSLIRVSKSLKFSPSKFIYIKWMASDITGNELISEPFRIQIDSPPKSVIDSPQNGDKFDISNSIVFDGNSSFDPDDKDILKYSWISNTSGNLGFGSSIEMMLTDIGWHKITLTVTDQYGLSSSAHVDIYVFKELISLINMKPELTNCTITPKSGDTDSEFTFSVKYYDKDSDLPTFIKVIIDGQEFNLTLKPGENGSNGIYEYKTKLSEDNHSYYFMVNDGFTDIFSGNATTPRIIKPQSKSAENMDKSAKWVLTLIIILIVIIIIISIILIFSLIIRPKISKRHLNHKYNPPVQKLVKYKNQSKKFKHKKKREKVHKKLENINYFIEWDD